MLLFSYHKYFVKMFLHHITTVFTFFDHTINKIINRIFTKLYTLNVYENLEDYIRIKKRKVIFDDKIVFDDMIADVDVKKIKFYYL